MNDNDDAPKLKAVGDRLSTLDRMREFRKGQLDDPKLRHGTAVYYRKEIAAIDAAMAALRYHRAVVQGLDEPFGLLRELVNAYDGPADAEGRVRAAIRRARALLEEFDQAGAA